ncbi:hypothetical protein A5779_12960 [Mycolicibacterium peregrinum]|uniref:FHA domain-containing protein n=1 Tax=Mycolicibacterium peregrinum TaxID=43304 RepID=A0A1A0V7S4_MYCPR|nr:hypothetical protein A5779_12960 [Mycolicibacterium peregrinum]
MGTASSLTAPAPDLIVTVGGQRMLFCAADGDVIVGRDAAGVGLQLDHPAVSRVHVRLTPGPRWQIFDYESRNGIYIDGHRVYEGCLVDGMTVRFGAPEGLAVDFRYAVDDRDRMRRIGRAVSRRCADLGVSKRALRAQAGINRTTADTVFAGRCWPGTAACDAIAGVLSWPAGSLAAIAAGEPPEEITDVLSQTLRHDLLIESAALKLESIAAALPQLPACIGDRQRVSSLLQQLNDLKASVSGDPAAAGSDYAQILADIADIYRRHLTPRDAQPQVDGHQIAAPLATGAPLRSGRHEP